MQQHDVVICGHIKGFILEKNLINVTSVTKDFRQNTNWRNIFLFILVKSLLSRAVKQFLKIPKLFVQKFVNKSMYLRFGSPISSAIDVIMHVTNKEIWKFINEVVNILFTMKKMKLHSLLPNVEMNWRIKFSNWIRMEFDSFLCPRTWHKVTWITVFRT